MREARLMTSWLDGELEECRFADARLGKRFRTLLERLSKRMGETIPMACQDWAGTKAAYRFLSNQRVSEREILGGHFQATRDRLKKSLRVGSLGSEQPDNASSAFGFLFKWSLIRSSRFIMLKHVF
jgi:hypothetical protein